MPDDIAQIAQFGGLAEWEFMATGVDPNGPLDIAKRVISEAKLTANDFDKRVAAI
jgi:hypothetical protein